MNFLDQDKVSAAFPPGVRADMLCVVRVRCVMTLGNIHGQLLRLEYET
jgi:hypothetical protein